MALTIADIWKIASEERDRLRMATEWAAAYRAAEPQEPLLVEAKLSYYIVQFRQGDRSTGLMLIDPDEGTVGAMTGVHDSTEAMFRFFRPAEIPEIMERFARTAENTKDDQPFVRPADVTIENLKVEPRLFWEPCDQSLTPFKPFYRIQNVTPGGTGHFFVRVDGEIHTKITHGGAGM